jgi:exosome complex component RRP40
LSNESKFLQIIGKELKFEIAIGCNGLIWINSDKPKDLILLKQAICKFENIKDSDTEAFINEVLNEENKMDL